MLAMFEKRRNGRAEELLRLSKLSTCNQLLDIVHHKTPKPGQIPLQSTPSSVKGQHTTCQFCQDAKHRNSPNVTPSVCSVGRDDGVCWAESGVHSNANGFLQAPRFIQFQVVQLIIQFIDHFYTFGMWPSDWKNSILDCIAEILRVHLLRIVEVH